MQFCITAKEIHIEIIKQIKYGCQQGAVILKSKNTESEIVI